MAESEPNGRWLIYDGQEWLPLPGETGALRAVRYGLGRGMHLTHDGVHWVSLSYVLDLLDAAEQAQPQPPSQPQGEGYCVLDDLGLPEVYEILEERHLGTGQIRTHYVTPWRDA